MTHFGRHSTFCLILTEIPAGVYTLAYNARVSFGEAVLGRLSGVGPCFFLIGI